MKACFTLTHFQTLLTSLLIFAAFCASAQFHLEPAPLKNSRASSTNTAARTHADVLQLPFWDDFSVFNGTHPDSTKWIAGRSIWVNNTMGINAPTLNVATFDGLNYMGLPYNAEDIVATGYTDTLVSKPIDLSGNEIERDSLFLSFFYQWQGGGEAPDPADFLELSLKDEQGEWHTAITISPKNSFDRSVFYDTLIQIDSIIYFHDDFQFRFRSYGRESGPFDTWNIDYVYLNDNRHINDVSFPDRAPASLPTSLFGVYTAVPYRHFKEAENVIDTVQFDVQNMKDQAEQSVYFAVTGKFTNVYADSTVRIYETLLMDSTGVKRNPDGERNGVMTAFERVASEYDTGLPDPNNNDQFDSLASAVKIDLQITVISGDSTDDDRFDFQPIDFTINDTITRSFILSDYYAYDDGVAEYAAGLITAGTLVAYQFERLSSEPDTLIGFDIYFPRYGLTSNQTVNFYLYEDANGRPGEVRTTILKGIDEKGINEFQQVRFAPALLITDRLFYIGWQQPLAGKAIVGLDVDNDTGDRIFHSSDRQTWFQNQNVKGSLMIRPVFGSGEIQRVPQGIEEELGISVYPNPSTGSFLVEGHVDEIRIIDLRGKEVSFQTDAVSNGQQITISHPSGLYLMRIRKGKKTATQKILITR